MSQLFDLSSLLVMPFWFLIIFLPHWRWTKRIMGSVWVIAPAALLYALLVLPDVGEIFLAVSNPSLPAVQGLLGSASGATIGWVHFLAFDLFVARWAYLESREQEISAWLVSPALFFVLMLGPAGFLLYLGVRTAVFARRRTELFVVETG